MKNDDFWKSQFVKHDTAPGTGKPPTGEDENSVGAVAAESEGGAGKKMASLRLMAGAMIRPSTLHG